MADEFYHKVCLAGAVNVGKTTMFYRIKNGEFVEHTAFTLTETKYRFSLDANDHATLVSRPSRLYIWAMRSIAVFSHTNKTERNV